MNEMVDRVQLAICKETHTGGQCAEPGNCGFCHTAAWAAIAAMREPTSAMCQAGLPKTIAMPLGNGQEIQVPGLGSGPDSMWRAMVDAALAP